MPSSTPMFGVTWNLMRCFSAVSRRLLPEPSSRARMSCGAPVHLLHPRQHDLQHRCTLHLERQYLVLVPGAPWTPGTRSFPAVLHLSHESKESSIRHLERQYLVLVPGAPWTPGTSLPTARFPPCCTLAMNQKNQAFGTSSASILCLSLVPLGRPEPARFPPCCTLAMNQKNQAFGRTGRHRQDATTQTEACERRDCPRTC